jgi:hypothetical protein
LDTTSAEPELDPDQDQDQDQDLDQPADAATGDPTKDGLPWSIRAAFSFSKLKGQESQSTLNFGGTINLTRSWLVTYNASYDMETRQVHGQHFSIARDLHCWEMSINRTQLGDRWEYYFRITLKAHPELYADQGPRGLTGGAGIPGQFAY